MNATNPLAVPNDPTTPRTEFGLERSACACADCQLNCREMPGFLVPSDLDRLPPPDARHDPIALAAWARTHLRASPGSILWSATLGYFCVPTLVPARTQTGCVWLNPDGRCAVHHDAPFGCAFFSCADSRADAADRVRPAIVAIMDDLRKPQSRYRTLWIDLNDRGLRARPPAESRRAMADILNHPQPTNGHLP